MTVLVTGSTGLIGTALVRSLAKRNGYRVVAAARNADMAKNLFEGYANIESIKWDVLESLSFEGEVDAIIHAASPTASRDFVERPVEVITAIIEGTRNALEAARHKNVKSMVFLSTMEVYGIPSAGNVTECDYGYLDPVSVRSSYPESKRLAEAMCIAYAKEYNIPVKIARLTQTFGAGVKRGDERVFAQFGTSVAEGRDIVLHTEGRTERCYCSLNDAVSAIETILCKGVSGEAYNVANPETYCSIADMARNLAKRYPASSVRFDVLDVPKRGYAPEFRMKLDISKLKALGWSPTQKLDDMFDEMIAWWGQVK
jgi:nucleoside-diphosphate-sugar epimerase